MAPASRFPLAVFLHCDRESGQVNVWRVRDMPRINEQNNGRGRMPKEFAGKVVVVSGGSRGIGRAIALAFAREGAQTVLAAANAANLTDAAKAIAAAGGLSPLTIAGDLRTLDGCQQVFDQVKQRFGRCDVLVNNAGATKGGKFSDQPDADWTDGFALKFFGAVRLTRLFWPLLKDAHGSIVNIIGAAARTPGPEFLVGGAVNAAFANFSKGLTAMGNKDDININVIHPGSTQTDRVEQLYAQYAKAQDKTVEQVRAEAVSKSGLRRIGQPEDIAELALYLASPKARHIQGTAIVVDGGGTPGYY
jgi:3-oxoacyl-[acyl-carrier protein] reductase